MNKLEKLLFQLTIFLIPTNLAYHFITKQSYINGILVDYLIPKLYLSDIPILILLFLWLVKAIKNKTKISFRFPHILFLILLPIGLLSNSPLASAWFWLKLTQLYLFFLWIKTHIIERKSLSKLYQLTYISLIITLLFQSLLGIYQFIFQKSLIGYWFLGESVLTHSSNIAKGNFSMLPFIKNGFKILPYGTTPHPNVLAGFLSIGMILLLLIAKKGIKSKAHKNPVLLITLILSSLTLLLTLSGSAWISFIIGVSMHSISPKPNKARIIKAIISLILISLTVFTLLTRDNLLIDSYSISRRNQLNHIAWQMFQRKPLSGVGLNNFTARINQFGTIHTYTSFIQPPHNVYLLWLSETGLLGIALVLLILINLKVRKFKYLVEAAPILMILIIGLVDHYLLTLQTGQLIAIMSLISLKTVYRTI